MAKRILPEPPPPRLALTPTTLRHLRASGLSDDTIIQAEITDSTNPLTAQLLATHKTDDGYYIPYFDLERKRVEGHYRVRLLNGAQVEQNQRYAQPRNSGNRVYIPPLFDHSTWLHDSTYPLFITEGEKKSLAAAQAGIVALGLGGVYSWRSKIFVLPRSAVKIEDGPKYKKIHVDADEAKAISDNVVPEFPKIDWNERPTYIAFDSDIGTNDKVAQAAYDLANYLEEQGADARVLYLPTTNTSATAKVGLDDWLLEDEVNAELLSDEDWLYEHSKPALPPSPSLWVADQLNKQRVTRPIAQHVATTVVRILDERGTRYRDAAGNYYYFDAETKILHEFRADTLPRLRESSFGNLLQTEYNLETADMHVMSRLLDRFVGETELIMPRRVTAAKGDALYLQLNDSAMARVTADGISFVDNGTDDVLMLADSVAGLDEDDVAQALRQPEIVKARATDLKWYEAVSTINLTPIYGLSRQESLELLTSLFYMSPFLNRWRGVNLPLEVAVAEPGSGKTFLYNLRKGILTGRPQLSGLPDDFKGWVASISSSGGLWVCDNLGGARGDYWHRLNDELARLITDPEPSIDLRQLYTTSGLQHIPVDVAFAITTIKNPFTSPDILQRSIIFELNAIPSGERDSDWFRRRIDSRAEWVAEHLLALRRFLKSAIPNWSPRFNSGFRLAGFEQSLLHMGHSLGFDLASVVRALPSTVSQTVAAYDPVIEALATFKREWRKGPNAKLSDVIAWVDMDPDSRFGNLKTFANVITLGRYISAHKYDVLQSTGIAPYKVGNQTFLKITDNGS